MEPRVTRSAKRRGQKVTKAKDANPDICDKSKDNMDSVMAEASCSNACTGFEDSEEGACGVDEGACGVDEGACGVDPMKQVDVPDKEQSDSYKTWEAKMQPILQELDNEGEKKFDYSKYCSETLQFLKDSKKKEFSSLCKGKSEKEVCHLFVASLTMASDELIDIVSGDENDFVMCAIKK